MSFYGKLYFYKNTKENYRIVLFVQVNFFHKFKLTKVISRPCKQGRQ